MGEQAMEGLGQHGEEIRRFSQTFETRCAANDKTQIEMWAELKGGLEKVNNFDTQVRNAVVQNLQQLLGSEATIGPLSQRSGADNGSASGTSSAAVLGSEALANTLQTNLQALRDKLKSVETASAYVLCEHSGASSA